MVEDMVSAQAGDEVVDGRGRTVEDPGDLPVGHAVDSEVGDLVQEFGSFQPVGCGEGLAGEGLTAMKALEALDSVRRSVAFVVSGTPEAPVLGRVVEVTFGIGAVGWGPSPGGSFGGTHALGRARVGPGTISEAEPNPCGRTVRIEETQPRYGLS